MSQGTSRIAWYVSRRGDGGNGEASGPFATDLVLAMLRDGVLQPLDLVFREGETEWRPASTYRELKSYRESGRESERDAGPNSASDKSKSESGGSSSFANGRSESHARGSANSSAGSSTNSPAAVSSSPSSASSAGGRTLSWIVLRPHNSTYLQEGPFETQVIIDGLQRGRFQFSQYAWHVGMNNWMRIGDLREFDRRSRSRESKPHVPPPLPDPIAAVILEDDKDAEAEEFHVMMRGTSKQDLTPNPLESMQALNVSQLGSVGIGGAAAESPEERKAQQKAGHAMSIVVSPNLAAVPWEQDPSDGYAQSVELIDDEHSGVHMESPFADDESIGARSLSGARPGIVETPVEANGVFHLAPAELEEPATLDKTPLPLIPPAAMPAMKDTWDKWGRYVAGAGMATLALIFATHLIVSKPAATSKAALSSRRAEAIAAAAATNANNANSAKTENRTETASGTATVTASAPVAQIPFAPQASAPSDLAIVGLKLDRPDGRIVIQGSVPMESPVRVTFKGRLGQILSKLSVRKTVEVRRKGGEIPSIGLKDLKLPAGAYTVEVEAGGAIAKNEIFVGQRDRKFLDRLETHLREVSLETQAQKKALFYTAQELDVLARDLGQNYGQLRAKPESWNGFFAKWNARLTTLARSLNDLEKKNVDDQAYPEETASLVQALTSLKNLAGQYQQAIGQKRDIASDALTELIAELARQKDAIGSSTSRPTADTPDGML